jgi:hypothetical protein
VKSPYGSFVNDVVLDSQETKMAAKKKVAKKKVAKKKMSCCGCAPMAKKKVAKKKAKK